MKRVMIISNSTFGIVAFRRELITALAEKYEVFVLSGDTGKADEIPGFGCKLTLIDVDRRGTNPVRDFGLLLKYLKHIKRIKPDIVLTYTIKPNVYGGLACRLTGTPYAANVTGLGTAFEGTGILRKFAALLNKIALRKAKTVFFENSADMELFTSERIVDKSKAHVLHGAGVNVERFSYQPYPDNDEFRFLFIGRVMKEKGVNELLEAMRHLIADGYKCSLDILGHYEENYKSILDKAVQEGWLRYHGSQPDVRPFISACDCFVLPSYHEGMANTNLESASSGRPVITSDIPGCREAVTEGSGLLCEPKNPESLCNAMKKMIELSREERELMGKAGRRHMEEVFDKRKVVAETIQVLLG